MFIGIDASRATSSKPTGTETYARELIRALIAIDRENHYRLYLRESVSPDFFAPQADSRNPQPSTPLRSAQDVTRITNYELRFIPFPRLWTHLRLSYEMFSRSPDLLWVPSHVLPLIHPRRSIVTVHDLGHLHFPQAHPPRQRLYHTWSTQWNARAASYLFADSEATRDDLVQFCRVAPEKVSVVYPAYDAQHYQPVRDASVIERVCAQYRVGKDYVLAIGTIHPRKNYTRLIQAFAKLQCVNYQLLIVGKRGWLYDAIYSHLESLNLQSRVFFLDYVPSSDMAALISGARLLAFPSLHEGFGLPVLEAQACGTPVVCSLTSSFPEVAGDGALFVDPLDEDAIAGAMQRVIEDESLRGKLVENGFRNIKRFSWEQSAHEVLKVICN
ncbi:MAG: glycosyltransferase family 4 protein [Chloroflexi bacterium]|nr:glycosyltransferase family 4 protein [Chloroflexota bacterium]